MTQQDRIHFNKIEFYITNVCNLNCERCNRFNNHHFTGWQRWSDYAEAYQKWSQYVDIEQIVILGGEPMLNPSIVEWVKGLNQIWPRAVQVLTNGTRLNHVKGVYDLFLGDKSAYPEIRDHYVKSNQMRNWLGVSWHNAFSLDELEKEIRQFLKGNINCVKGKSNNKFDADLVWTDSNDISVPVWIQDSFTDAAVQVGKNGFELHNNDPEEAHANCGFAQNKNYHFIRGKLYKCGPVALFPEFDQQHRFANISDEDRELINAYHPLAVDEFEQRGCDFIDKIDQVIPQCRFCPVDPDYRQITAIRKNSS